SSVTGYSSVDIEWCRSLPIGTTNFSRFAAALRRRAGRLALGHHWARALAAALSGHCPPLAGRTLPAHQWHMVTPPRLRLFGNCLALRLHWRPLHNAEHIARDRDSGSTGDGDRFLCRNDARRRIPL